MRKNGIICALILATPFVGGCGTSHETLVDDFTLLVGIILAGNARFVCSQSNGKKTS